MMEHETSGSLLWLLRRAGDEWGPLRVALAAAHLTDTDALIARLQTEPTATESAADQPTGQ